MIEGPWWWTQVCERLPRDPIRSARSPGAIQYAGSADRGSMPRPMRWRVSRVHRACRGSVRRSRGLPGAPAAGPGPLEVIAAEPTGDVDGLTDDEQAWNVRGLHRPRGQIACVDSASGHLGFGIALGAGRRDLPRLQVTGEFSEGAV